jgi:hypothetical protein
LIQSSSDYDYEEKVKSMAHEEQEKQNKTITWLENWRALVKDGSESKLAFFCISGTFLVT